MQNHHVAIATMLPLIILPANAYAEHIFDAKAHAQYLDISQLESEKWTFKFDGKDYDFYYGYHGSLDSMGSDYIFPVLDSMNINEERKSLEITMKDVPEPTDFWVRMPEEAIYAEDEKFVVMVDGVDTRYDLMKFPNDYVVGFFITEDTKNIEIIGTRVIPEFGVFAISILGISILGMVYIMRKHSGLSKNMIGT